MEKYGFYWSKLRLVGEPTGRGGADRQEVAPRPLLRMGGQVRVPPGKQLDLVVQILVRPFI